MYANSTHSIVKSDEKSRNRKRKKKFKLCLVFLLRMICRHTSGITEIKRIYIFQLISLLDLSKLNDDTNDTNWYNRLELFKPLLYPTELFIHN